MFPTPRFTASHCWKNQTRSGLRLRGCDARLLVLTWHEPKWAEPGVFIAQPGWRSQSPALLCSVPQRANIWSQSTLNMFEWPELLGQRDRGADLKAVCSPPWWSRKEEATPAGQRQRSSWSLLTSCSHTEEVWAAELKYLVEKRKVSCSLNLLFLLFCLFLYMNTCTVQYHHPVVQTAKPCLIASMFP